MMPSLMSPVGDLKVLLLLALAHLPTLKPVRPRTAQQCTLLRLTPVPTVSLNLVSLLTALQPLPDAVSAVLVAHLPRRPTTGRNLP